MKTIKETKIEMETVEDIFSCPIDPKDENSDSCTVVTRTENLDEFEMSISEAAEKLGVPYIAITGVHDWMSIGVSGADSRTSFAKSMCPRQTTA
jgi:hypothetical protein